MKGTLDQRRLQALQRLCTILDIHFNNIALLHQALTHTSFANEAKAAAMQHNERLEFLGDAILDLIISDYLYKRFPNLPEGELTKARAVIVCEPSLAQRAAQLGVGDYLLLGKGESLSGGRTRASILADSFEAILGAIYLDNGIAVATNFVLSQLRTQLDLVERGQYVRDYKTLLQEVIQKDTANTLHYEVVSEQGPDHDKSFEVVVLVNDKTLGRGLGKSKKEAEQSAAHRALVQLKALPKD